MPYLTATVAQKTERTYRYFVELASDKLDYEGVPESFRIVDVVVCEPTEDAIAALLQAAGHLEDYGIVSHWIPEDCNCF